MNTTKSILAAISILTAISCSAQETTSMDLSTKTFIGADDDRIEYMGRTSRTIPNAVRFTYPGVSILTQFDGTFLAMKAKPGSGYFMVEIDDRLPFKIKFGEADTVQILAASLPEGSHTARIMYAVEGYELKPAFHGFYIDPNATLGPKPTLPERRMEFIGNSITCGYGVEGTEADKFTYDTENHYYTYAALTARELNAQHFAVARSGIGIYRNYGAPREGSKENMPYKYYQTLFDDNTETWDYGLYTPDVVCLNLGTNDTSLDNYDTALLGEAYSNFVARLRNIYPNAHIVLLSGSMMNGQALADVKAALDKVADQAQSKGDTRIHRFDFSPQTGNLGYGADWHPSMRQQRKMADELIPFIKSITGWE